MIVSHAFQDLRFEKRARDAVFGILIAEDLVAILMLATISALVAGTGDTGKILLTTAGRLVLVVAALLGVGLLVVPPTFRFLVALRRKETLLVTSVGFCFALALLAQSQGLSVALGAFMAGALISEAGVSRHVEPLIEPLRDMFTGIFFVSIGMLFDPRGAERLALDPGPLAVVLVGKSVGVTVGSFLSGQPVRTAVQAGMSLTQIGEFSFVIATIGAGLSAGAGASSASRWRSPCSPRSHADPHGTLGTHRPGGGAKLPRPLQVFVSLYGRGSSCCGSRARCRPGRSCGPDSSCSCSTPLPSGHRHRLGGEPAAARGVPGRSRSMSAPRRRRHSRSWAPPPWRSRSPC